MAEKAIEVEFKFEVKDPSKVNFLKELDFLEEKKVDDTYLDTEQGNLFKRAIFIRIRNGKRLDFKFNPSQFDTKPGEGVHEQCEEHNFTLPLQENDLEEFNKTSKQLGLVPLETADFETFRSQNKLIDSQVFKKMRKKYSKSPFEYCLDVVEDFGTFLEIEATTTDLQEAERLKEQIREIAKTLNLKLITTGYNELYWRKHNFELYLQGKFLLEEDKPKKQ